jgi:hypothetical protein
VAALATTSLVAWSVATVFATTFVPVSDEALVEAAPLIAVVRVIDIDERAEYPSQIQVRGRRGGPADVAGSGGSLSTLYRVRVERILKGRTAGPLLEVRVLGGHAPGGRTLKIFGAPRFRRGERALLFLEPSPRLAGTFRLVDFLLGAFHQVGPAGHSLAVRDLSQAQALTRDREGVLRPATSDDAPRYFATFARWIERRAAGETPAASYRVSPLDAAQREALDKFTLFTGDDGHAVRWFEFDSGGSVSWRANQSGQTGLAGGGFAQAQSAIAAWNADADSTIDYLYAGTTTAAAGFTAQDGENTILWDDPNGEIPTFNCGHGGILAIGGPWVLDSTATYQGLTYHPIVEADVVLASGLSCYFSGATAAAAAEELLGHELGHTLGLGHSCGDASSGACDRPELNQALMRAVVHNDGRGAMLGTDDRAAIALIYGAGIAAPGGLTAAALSSARAALDWEDRASNESGYRIEMKSEGGSFAEVLAVPAGTTNALVAGLSAVTTYTFRVRAATFGGFSGYSNEAVVTTPADPTGGGTCTASGQALCLDGGRFRVEVAWRLEDGRTGAGNVVPAASTDSGLFWFFAPANWEAMVKVLDGCGVNGAHWVFFAAATNVEFTLTVTDTYTGTQRTYHNPQGVVAPVVTDTAAFPTCP